MSKLVKMVLDIVCSLFGALGCGFFLRRADWCLDSKSILSEQADKMNKSKVDLSRYPTPAVHNTNRCNKESVAVMNEHYNDLAKRQNDIDATVEATLNSKESHFYSPFSRFLSLPQYWDVHGANDIMC